MKVLTGCLLAAVVSAAPAFAAKETLPDLVIRTVHIRDMHHVSAFVMNASSVDAPATVVRLTVHDAQSQEELWSLRANAPALPAGKTAEVRFDTGAHSLAALLVRAHADATRSVVEADENNNAQDAIAPKAIIKLEEPKAPLALKKKPPAAMSPDLEAVSITLQEKRVLGVVRNVGDRQYLAAGSGYEDSFARKVTLRRVKTVRGKEITEEVGSFDIPHLGKGESQSFAFPKPPKDNEATKYRWMLVISGNDPNDGNDIRSLVQSVTKMD